MRKKRNKQHDLVIDKILEFEEQVKSLHDFYPKKYRSKSSRNKEKMLIELNKKIAKINKVLKEIDELIKISKNLSEHYPDYYHHFQVAYKSSGTKSSSFYNLTEEAKGKNNDLDKNVKEFNNRLNKLLKSTSPYDYDPLGLESSSIADSLTEDELGVKIILPEESYSSIANDSLTKSSYDEEDTATLSASTEEESESEEDEFKIPLQTDKVSTKKSRNLRIPTPEEYLDRPEGTKVPDSLKECMKENPKRYDDEKLSTFGLSKNRNEERAQNKSKNRQQQPVITTKLDFASLKKNASNPDIPGSGVTVRKEENKIIIARDGEDTVFIEEGKGQNKDEKEISFKDIIPSGKDLDYICANIEKNAEISLGGYDENSTDAEIDGLAKKFYFLIKNGHGKSLTLEEKTKKLISEHPKYKEMYNEIKDFKFKESKNSLEPEELEKMQKHYDKFFKEEPKKKVILK